MKKAKESGREGRLTTPQESQESNVCGPSALKAEIKKILNEYIKEEKRHIKAMIKIKEEFK